MGYCIVPRTSSTPRMPKLDMCRLLKRYIGLALIASAARLHANYALLDSSSCILQAETAAVRTCPIIKLTRAPMRNALTSVMGFAFCKRRRLLCSGF